MNNLTKAIYDLEVSLLTPKVRSSFNELNALLADDFREFGSSGLVYTKQNILERLPKEDGETIYNVSDFEITELTSDIVMANFKTERIKDGKQVNSLRTSLWRRYGDTWQMFFHQGTKIN